MHRPRRWHVTRWHEDPYSGGAYASLLPGGQIGHRLLLAEPLDGQLILAGEAYHSHPGMTHSAWESGNCAARHALEGGARRVLVIGAGLAGLAAARALVASGATVQVLEARERIGGRTHSIELGGIHADAGAAWLQQYDRNGLARLAEQLGLATVATDFSRPLAAAHDGPVPDIDEAYARFLRHVDRSLPLEQAVRGHAATLSPAERRALGFALDGNLILEAGLPLSRLSMAALEEEGVGNGDRYLPGGYRQLVDHLAQGLDIRLGHEVRRIERSASGVRVDGIAADCCICTVPIGALGRIDFLPDLPGRYREALSYLAMGQVEKVILQFEERWWPVSPSGYLRWYDEPANWGEWLDLTEGVGSPTIAGLIAADAVEREFRGRTDEEIAHSAAYQLQRWAERVKSYG
ncbi:flavin monoamine oxidase family protein [Pseudomonas sp. Q1-7]|uniref:flavin monoamine oxidase family protein n=1 Tax=Pseudomonas sp. Q1-7 TaxID=3020843 RepID=UPI00230155F2|nr:FAD-dependent oxidoreductase [Pseudomonas sp. Q1-7]